MGRLKGRSVLVLALAVGTVGCGDDLPRAGDASVPTWFRDQDGDGYGDDRITMSAVHAPPGYVAGGGDCNDLDRRRHPVPLAEEPAFVLDRCGEGRIVDPMTDATTGWSSHTSVDDGSGSVSMIGEGGGCGGGGRLALSYDLPTPSSEACGGVPCSWVVRRKVFDRPIDLSREDYLIVPFGGEPGDPNLHIDLKLQGSDGCMITWQIRNATDLPVRRAVVVPLAYFSSPDVGHSCVVNLAALRALEIGVVGPPPPTGMFADDTGRLHVDAITAVRADEIRLQPTSFNCPPENPTARRRIADDLLARHGASLIDHGHPFVQSWFEEGAPGPYHIYNQAQLLGLLSIEAARSGDPSFRQAAIAVADTLVALQRQVTSAEGRWHDVYQDAPGGGLAPGGDTAFSWYGNTAWVAINLDLFRDLVMPSPSQPYDDAIEAAAAWLEGEIRAFGAAGGAPGAVTRGTEGNVSAFFALVAAEHFGAAAAMRDYLLAHAWKAGERRFWMGIDHPGLAIDVVGNWGAAFLRAVGRHDEALAGLGMAGGIFPVRSFGGTLFGLGDMAGPWQPAVEFTAQYVAAGGPGSTSLVRELLKLESAGTFPGSPDDFDGGDGWNTRWHGIAPAAWLHAALSPDYDVLGRLTLPMLADDFEGPLGFGLFEELVEPMVACYATGAGEVALSTDQARSGTTSLRVWANRARGRGSNHLSAQQQLATAGQSGTWQLDADVLVPADAASGGQTGPEFSLQNTRLVAGRYETVTAGIQYVANAGDPNAHHWGVWARRSDGSAGWLYPTEAVRPLQPGAWYHLTLVTSFDTNRTARLTISGPGGTTTFDYLSYEIASELKWNEEAFWLTLEAENLWNGCGAGPATDYRVYYDNVVVRAR